MSNDLREEVLRKHYPDFDIKSGWMFDGDVLKVFDAMDEYFEKRSMELLEWMAKEEVYIFNDGKTDTHFQQKGEWYTAKELFQNFL